MEEFKALYEQLTPEEKEEAVKYLRILACEQETEDNQEPALSHHPAEP